MGLFSRRSTSQPPPEPPIVIAASDLERAGELVATFLASAGNDPGLHFAGSRIAIASGAPTMEQVAMGKAPATGLARPWRWLAAVAERAENTGDDLLVARVALMARFFVTALAPRMGLGNHLEMRLDPPSHEVLRGIYATAVRALPRLPAGTVIVDHPTGTVTAGDVLLDCSNQLRPR
ncbi:hypothetical protein ACFO3J_20690 [Streptomyces polygonati]|uniref:Uncharacterized protein n=1 Tax=Streptomyces polygonati TaxID=1617087 RepID=A0ABV8HSK6_9ACTN